MESESYSLGHYTLAFIVSSCIYVRSFLLLLQQFWLVSRVVKFSVTTHIWTIVTMEGWFSHHDSKPQGTWMGLEVKIYDTVKKYDKVSV